MILPRTAKRKGLKIMYIFCSLFKAPITLDLGLQKYLRSVLSTQRKEQIMKSNLSILDINLFINYLSENVIGIKNIWRTFSIKKVQKKTYFTNLKIAQIDDKINI